MFCCCTEEPLGGGRAMEVSTLDETGPGAELGLQTQVAEAKNEEPVLEKAPPGVQAAAQGAVQEKLEAAGAPMSSHFTVTVEKTQATRSVGISIDRLDAHVLQVIQIADGIIANHNKVASEDKTITPGCFILAVNNHSGSVQQMIDEMKRSTQLTLKIAPKLEFDVNIKKEGLSLMLDLQYQPDSSCIMVNKIGDGLVKAYNDSVADESKKVRPGDRIMEVNKMQGLASKLVDELKEAAEVTFKVVRPKA